MSEERILPPIREFVSRSFDGQDFQDEDNIFALGFGNSLFAIQIVSFVESEFGIEIEAEDMEMTNFRSIKAISEMVDRKLVAVAS